MDTIEGPFTYDALAPESINFVPLKESKSYDAKSLLKHYESHQQLKAFVHIIQDKPKYPVFFYLLLFNACSIPCTIVRNAEVKFEHSFQCFDFFL